jgi:methylglyoxal synthase
MNASVKLMEKKHIALIAHDARKSDLLEWVQHNRKALSAHALYATGSTGKLLAEETGLEIFRFKSGPLGGDQQIGARIVDGEIDFLVFFWDPLEPQPHDPDIKALLRLAVLYNIPTASNRSTADFLISSPFMSAEYHGVYQDYDRRLRQAQQD